MKTLSKIQVMFVEQESEKINFIFNVHTAHQIGALQFQLQKILFGTSQKCRDGQQTLISCTSFQILHLQLAVLFQTKSPMSTFSVSGPKILSHIMPRSADDDTVSYYCVG